MVPSAFSYVDDGDFYVEYLETENFVEYRDWIKNGMGKKIGFFEDRANDLNSKFRLPHDVPIYFHECETANAFYNGGEKYIVFCYELVEEIHSIMEKNHWSGDSAYATLGVVDWILFHEVGHALIDIHNLPITGLEEDSADQFATYQFLNDDSELPIIHTAFFWWYIQSNNYSDAAYADTHSLDVQRFYNLACWSQGKEDPNGLSWVESGYLPENRAKWCESEYNQLTFSWDKILEPIKFIPETTREMQANYEHQQKMQAEYDLRDNTAKKIAELENPKYGYADLLTNVMRLNEKYDSIVFRNLNTLQMDESFKEMISKYDELSWTIKIMSEDNQKGHYESASSKIEKIHYLFDELTWKYEKLNDIIVEVEKTSQLSIRENVEPQKESSVTEIPSKSEPSQIKTSPITKEQLAMGKSQGIVDRQDLLKRWNKVFLMELPVYNFPERLNDLRSDDNQNNILKQRIDDIEKQILVVKEKLNHLRTPYNPETLEEIIALENMIQTTDLYLKDIEQSPQPMQETTNEGGGCLIATAAYGSELAPQVQFLRELRDNTVLQTTSGTTFMTGFNQFYYSFSPQIADYERENPVFKEAVKATLTPLLTSLTLLNYVEIDSEEEMLGYGIGIILLNVGIYFVMPAVLIISIKKRFFKKITN